MCVYPRRAAIRGKKNTEGEPRYFCILQIDKKMSATVHMQQQQAALRTPGGGKPYSLFVMSPERVLGLKRAAEVSEMPISTRPRSRWRERDYTPVRFTSLFLFPRRVGNTDISRSPCSCYCSSSFSLSSPRCFLQQPFLTHEEGGEQRFAKTPKTKSVSPQNERGPSSLCRL